MTVRILKKEVIISIIILKMLKEWLFFFKCFRTLPGVNSPHCAVSSGADSQQRRVSLRDIPGGFLHLHPVETRPDGRVPDRRLHGGPGFQVATGALTARAVSTWQVGSVQREGWERARAWETPPRVSGHSPLVFISCRKSSIWRGV